MVWHAKAYGATIESMTMLPSFLRAVPLRAIQLIAVLDSIALVFLGCDSNDPVGPPRPFIWRGAGVSLLTHATANESWTIKAADEINSRGQILAKADNSAGGNDHTVVLTPVAP